MEVSYVEDVVAISQVERQAGGRQWSENSATFLNVFLH